MGKIFVKFGAIILKIWYFVNYCMLHTISNIKIFFHIYDHTISAVHHISFLLDRFSVKYRFPFPVVLFFTLKSPIVTQRSVSQGNAFTRAKTHRFFAKLFRLKWFYYSSWKQFQDSEAWIQGNTVVHYSLCAKCTQLWPHNTANTRLCEMC